MARLVFLGCVLAVLLTLSTAEELRAIVRLTATSVNSEVKGNITFVQNRDGGEVRIMGNVTGLDNGKKGFHIHEKGDIGEECVAAGGHFNPENKLHGAPDAIVRHVGDLGNIESKDKLATINFTDSVISLTGPHSILGRALVVHEKEDDLGLKDTNDSRKTGDAGRRVACGVVGIQSPLDAWEKSAASSFAKTSTMALAAVVVAMLKQLTM